MEELQLGMQSYPLLGNLCLEMGTDEDLEKAEHCFGNLIEFYMKFQDAGSLNHIGPALELAMVNITQGKLEDAEKVISNVYTTLNNSNDAQSKILKYEANVISGLLISEKWKTQGDTRNNEIGVGNENRTQFIQELGSIFLEASLGLTASLGPNSPTSVVASMVLGKMYLDNGTTPTERDQGRQILENPLDILSKSDRLMMVNIMTRLIRHHEMEGKPKQAKKMKERKRKILVETYGLDMAASLIQMTHWNPLV